MRVSGVNIFSYNNTCQTTDKRQNKVIAAFVPDIKGYDRFDKTISFTANPISTHGQFRYLAKNHDIHCLYCKKIMIYTGSLEEMLKSGLFSGRVEDFINAVTPLRKRMKKGQRTAFDQIKNFAQKNPDSNLSEAIQYLYQNSIKSLVKKQAKIFKELFNESANLTPEIQTKFRQFMKIQHKRLYEIPHIEDFSPEVFTYKVHKMTQCHPNKNLKAYLAKITEPLNNPIFKNDNTVIPKEIGRQISKSKKLVTARDYKKFVIKQVHKIGKHLGKEDIVRLCKTSQAMLDGKPVIITFSNKEFMHDLSKKVLKDIRKTPTYIRMMEISNTLPNSNSNMNSFIVKHRYSDSNTIGYKLFEPSTATLEHLMPQVEGGVDDLTNCALACKADNNGRGHEKLFSYLRKWNPRNQQIYFNDIISIANTEHAIKPSDIEGMSQTLLTEGHINIDISKLKK